MCTLPGRRDRPCHRKASSERSPDVCRAQWCGFSGVFGISWTELCYFQCWGDNCFLTGCRVGVAPASNCVPGEQTQALEHGPGVSWFDSCSLTASLPRRGRQRASGASQFWDEEGQPGPRAEHREHSREAGPQRLHRASSGPLGRARSGRLSRL